MYILRTSCGDYSRNRRASQVFDAQDAENRACILRMHAVILVFPSFVSRVTLQSTYRSIHDQAGRNRTSSSRIAYKGATSTFRLVCEGGGGASGYWAPCPIQSFERECCPLSGDGAAS